MGRRRIEPMGRADHRARVIPDHRERIGGTADGVEVRQRLAAQLRHLLLHPFRLGDAAPAQPAFEEVDVVPRQPRVGRAQEGEQVAPLAVEPRVAQQREQRLAERRLAQPQPALERVGHAERREGRVQRGPPAVERRADDRDLVSGSAVAQQRKDLVRDELERAADAGALEEAQRAVQFGSLRCARAEERAFQVAKHRRTRFAARRELLDPSLGQAREVLGRPRQRGEGVPPGLVRQRDGHLGACGERLEQRPLGPGQILEAVREHGSRLPRRQVAGGALGGVAALELPVPDPEPVELRTVGGVERRQLAVELAGLEQRGLELGHGRAERVGEARETRGTALGSRDDAPEQQRALRLADHAPVRAVAPRDPLEQVVERADRPAHECAGARQQLALRPVDVRPVRHDQDRIGIERVEVTLEQERDLPRIRRARKQAQRHPPHPSVGR